MNSEKGRNANRMGRYIAREIASEVGAKLKNKVSNECIYENEKSVIKTSRLGNNLFGITKKMHERLESVILAVETNLHYFDVYYIPMDMLLKYCTTTGDNSGKGKVISYNVYDAMKIGKKIKGIETDLSDFDL